MTTIEHAPGTAAPETKGLVMHSEARYYDLLAWLLTLGRERAFRERLVEIARLAPGERVLDVGCGTGTLAIAAKRRVGPTGAVHGIDPSPEMIDRATRKAAQQGADVGFRTGVAEALPFPDAHFDAVFSTLMLHHLPRPVREQCAREMRRVLKPGGRVLAVDFAAPAHERKGLLGRMHRHGHMKLRDIVELLDGAGFRVVESGAVGVRDVQFALGRAPGGDADLRDAATVTRSFGPLPAPHWMLAVIVPAVVLAIVAGHLLAFRVATSRLALSTTALAILFALGALHHFGLAGVIHGVLRRRRHR